MGKTRQFPCLAGFAFAASFPLIIAAQPLKHCICPTYVSQSPPFVSPKLALMSPRLVQLSLLYIGLALFTIREIPPIILGKSLPFGLYLSSEPILYLSP
jgi:hypothetical protein